jgi:hypothetical protein
MQTLSSLSGLKQATSVYVVSKGFSIALAEGSTKVRDFLPQITLIWEPGSVKISETGAKESLDEVLKS